MKLSAASPDLASPTLLRGPDAAVPSAAGVPRGFSVRRNFVWALAGNLAYAASQWAMLVLLTKSGSPELVGQFALGLALTGPIILFANLQLRSIQATDAAAEFAFIDYFKLRTMAVILAVGIIGCLAAFGGYHSMLSQVILALGMARGIECFSEIYLGLFQRHERMDLVAISLVLKAILSLASFASAIFFTGSLVWATWGLFLAWTLVFFFFDARLGRRLIGRSGGTHQIGSSRKWLRLGWLALPLGIAALLKALENSLPRYFIERQMGERELGLFAAMAYLTIVGVQVITALGQAAGPRLARLHAEGERADFVQLVGKLIALGFIIGATGVALSALIGRELLAALYTPEYARHNEVFIWLMLAAAITYMYSPLGTSLNALRVFRFRLPLHVVTLVLLAVCCWVMGKEHGLLGVAWAVCIAELFTAVLYGGVLFYHLRQNPNAAAHSQSSPCYGVS
jgi:O-antigen/teichoic acid export membrane protein